MVSDWQTILSKYSAEPPKESSLPATAGPGSPGWWVSIARRPWGLPRSRLKCLWEWRLVDGPVSFGDSVPGVFTPVLTKHSVSWNLLDSISRGSGSHALAD